MRYWIYFLVFGLVACTAVPESAAPEINQTPPEGEVAQVLSVIDGDTIEVEVGGQRVRLRYIGVDTPEQGDPFYEEAADLNQDLVGGKSIILVKDVSERDRYGRLLRYVYLPDGTFVNAELIRQGMARVVTFPPDVAMIDDLLALQVQARQAAVGLWGQSEAAAPPGCFTCSKNALNCGDFTTQPAAQACFEYCLAVSGEDIHHLDGGGDGVVCESLPPK